MRNDIPQTFVWQKYKYYPLLISYRFYPCNRAEKIHPSVIYAEAFVALSQLIFFYESPAVMKGKFSFGGQVFNKNSRLFCCIILHQYFC